MLTNLEKLRFHAIAMRQFEMFNENLRFFDVVPPTIKRLKVVPKLEINKLKTASNLWDEKEKTFDFPQSKFIQKPKNNYKK